MITISRVEVSRIKHEEIRRIAGFDVVVKSYELMEYDGSWFPAGFRVFLGGKVIGDFIGYPVDRDLEEVIEYETRPMIKFQ